MSVRTRHSVVGALCLTLVGVTLWGVANSEPRLPPELLPPAEKLDSMRAYLAPSGPPPRLDEYSAFLPAVAAPAPASAPVTHRVPWRVTAILLSGGRPVAIIDDQPIPLGGRLPGGAQVIAIHRDQVVIREPDGVRRTLHLPAG